MDIVSIEKRIESELKRFSSGYLRTVGLFSPKPPVAFLAQMGLGGGNGRHYNQLRGVLNRNLNLCLYYCTNISIGVHDLHFLPFILLHYRYNIIQ